MCEPHSTVGGRAGASIGGSDRAGCQDLKFVIADDDPAIRELVKIIVEQNGFRVTGVASDGDKAVRLCRDLKPDMAVLDLSMPRLNGIDAALQIKNGCPDTRIILLSAHPDGPCIFQSLCAGAAGYLTKDKAASGLSDAIGAVCRGEIYVCASGNRRCVSAFLAAAERRFPGETATAASMCLRAFLMGAKEPGALRRRPWEVKALRPGFNR